MAEYIHLLIATVAAHRGWAYALAFAMALAEALPVVGIVVPGSVIILGLGALIPSGAVGAWPMIVWAVLGATLGDAASFALGWLYRDHIRRLWPVRRYPHLLALGEHFFRRHGGKSVFFARFVQGPRAFVPLAAGVARMPRWRFAAYDVASALVWGPSHVLSGALVGASLSLAGAIATRLAVFLVVFLAVLWLAARLARWAVRRGLPLLDAAQHRLQAWAAGGRSRPRRVVLSVLDPGQPAFKGLAVLALLLVGAGWAFVGVLEAVVTGDPLVRMDTAVYHFLQGLRTAWADRLMVAVTELGDTVTTTVIAVVVALWLLARRHWHAAAYWLGAGAFAAGAALALRLGQWAQHPPMAAGGWEALLLLGGHTTGNTVLYGFLAVIVTRELRGRAQLALPVAMAVWVALIAFSRLYLGVHWLSDGLGGVTLGLAWVALLGMAYLRHDPPRVRARGLLAVVGIALLIGGGLHVTWRHAADMARYAPRAETSRVAASRWWAEGWRELPAYRLDLAGEWEEPLTVQWAGPAEALRSRLAPFGWHTPVPWLGRGALGWLIPAVAPERLPVLPTLERGRPPALELIRAEPSDGHAARRLVLRLWPSNVVLADGSAAGTPLWVGSVVEERFRRPLGLLTVSRTQPDFRAPLAELAGALPESRLVRRPLADPRPGWAGRVLLAHAAGMTLPANAAGAGGP